MANKMYKVVAEELKKEEEDIVEPDVELSDREQNDKVFANKLHRNTGCLTLKWWKLNGSEG